MKKHMSLLLVVTMLLSFTACGQTGKSEETTFVTMESTVSATEETTSETTEASNQYPVVLTDHAGREVVIEEEPKKLVSCYYITTSLLMALNLDEKMVGIENEPELRPVYNLSNPNLLELPWVGTAKTLDLEACAALEPDLVILPLRLKDSVPLLEAMGIDVLLVNPESQELLTEMIRMVATACNRTEKAEELLTFLSKQENYLESILVDVDTPKVYLSGNSNFLSTAGSAMYQADMISLAGGNNVAAEISDTYWTEIDYEQLLVWNPDYIILASSAKYTVEDVLSDPNLADCTAVVNRNVYQIPANAESWDSPVPSSILGALWLANILHPEQLTDTDCTAIMDDYYETFYHFTYSKN